MKKIPFIQLQDEYRLLQSQMHAAITRVLKSGRYILGTEVDQFEKEFAAFLGARYAIGVASGTDALFLALKAYGIGPGDEVIIPANSYPTVFAVAATGATVQLIDVDPLTLHLDSAQLKAVVTKKTKVIIPVHLYGRAVALRPILRFAKQHSLLVIEDCAQAHGAMYNGKSVGTFGDAGCFSFYPTKNLGAIGDGGMVVVKQKTLAKTLLSLRMYGETKRYHSARAGFNSRLDELQAAILRVKLHHLEKGNQKRQAIAAYYYANLPKEVLLSSVRHSNEHVYHLFVIRVPKHRDKLMRYLASYGIETGIHFPFPIHEVKAFAHLKTSSFPHAEIAAKEVLSLPCYPQLPLSSVSQICALVKKFFA